MQISLRSQMIAGTAAIVGATAIAVTPVMGTQAGLPALSTAQAEVALSALANPITALLSTVGLVGNYTLNGVNSVNPAVNWPNSGIGLAINTALPGYGVAAPGLLPNILLTPFPVAIQLATNALGYTYIAANSVAGAAGNVADIIWTVPATAFQIALDVLTFNFAAIPTDIVNAVTGIVNSASAAVTTLVNGVIAIGGTIVNNALNVVEYVVGALPNLLGAVVGQGQVLIGSVVNAFSTIVAGLSAPNPIEGVWNAAVQQLLSSAGLPGTVVNLTQGAGVQVNPADPTTFVPSVRTALTAPISGIATILGGGTPPPLPGAATEVAEVAPAASAVRADVAVAPAAEAAPAAEVADDSAADVRSDAAEVAAPSVVADSAPAAGGDAAAASDDAPAPAKAGAARSGRGK